MAVCVLSYTKMNEELKVTLVKLKEKKERAERFLAIAKALKLQENSRAARQEAIQRRKEKEEKEEGRTVDV